MVSITDSDIQLVNLLQSRVYKKNSLLSNASEEEKEALNNLIRRLKGMAEYFGQKYNNEYGPFEVSVTSGNHIQFGGTKLKRIWSGIFKGASNKQYATQISFVVNPYDNCLDVGFYFGRAAGRGFSREEVAELQEKLRKLGYSLAKMITDNDIIYRRFQDLFDLGFTAHSQGERVLADDWLNTIVEHPANCQIIAKVYPNEIGEIEFSAIEYNVRQVVFLMDGILNTEAETVRRVRPLTPQQFAKQAERRAFIGLEGELHVLEYEKNKLQNSGYSEAIYPQHSSLLSMTDGYDIVSLNEDRQEIFIEVKATTRTRNDPKSRSFFISTNEFNTFQNNMEKYKLYRVYDVEGTPSIEIIDLKSAVRTPNGYSITY